MTGAAAVAATALTELFRHDVESEQLLLVFGSGDAGDTALMRAAFALPMQAIMLMPRQPHSYPPAEAEALRALVAGLAGAHRRVAAVGAGSGGDAVLRHARLFKVRLAVVAVRPSQVAAGSEDISATAHGIPPDCDAFLLFDRDHPAERRLAADIAARASVVPVPAPGLAPGLNGESLLTRPDTLAAVLDMAGARVPRGSRRRDMAAWFRVRAHASIPYRLELARRLLDRGHAGWSGRLSGVGEAPFVALPQPTAAAASLAQVAALQAAGSIRQALQVARQVVRAAPTDAAALVVLAGLLRQCGDVAPAEAVEALLAGPVRPA